MKKTLILFVASTLFMLSCTKRADVQCDCQGNGQFNSYDFGIKNNPSLHDYIGKCDTFGSHNNLDTCNLVLFGD